MPIEKGTVNGCIAKTRDCSPSQQKEKERLCENSKLHTTSSRTLASQGMNTALVWWYIAQEAKLQIYADEIFNRKSLYGKFEHSCLVRK